MKQELKDYLGRNRKEIFQLTSAALLVVLGSLFVVGVLEGGIFVPEEIKDTPPRMDKRVGRALILAKQSSGAINQFFSSERDELAEVFLSDQRKRTEDMNAELKSITKDLNAMAEYVDEVRPRSARELIVSALVRRTQLVESAFRYGQAVALLLEAVEDGSADEEDRLDELLRSVNVEVVSINALNDEYEEVMRQFNALIEA